MNQCPGSVIEFCVIVYATVKDYAFLTVEGSDIVERLLELCPFRFVMSMDSLLMAYEKSNISFSWVNLKGKTCSTYFSGH